MPTSQKDVTLAEQIASADRGTLIDIPLDRIRVAEWNARKTCDPVGMRELTASVRDHGIQVPLLVRVMTVTSLHSVADHERVREGFFYELIAGHRRFKAAEEIALPTVPCIVRDLSDDEAREVGLIDNLQREDVPALEEADAYAELRSRLGTPAAIAQRVGKDVAYVARRLALVSLAEMPRKALAERLVTIDHALLLARLGEQEQRENLKWLLNPSAGVKEKLEDLFAARLEDLHDTDYSWEPQSPMRLKEHIEEHVGRKLSRAPWDLTATNLSEDGVACVGCPSNTRDNAALFGDLAIDEATCENGRCFEEKRTTFVHIRLAADAGDGALRLSWRDSTAAPRFEKETARVNPAQTFRHGQWVEAKKGSCENVIPGVTVDWSDSGNRGFMGGGGKLRKPGEILSVCAAAKCKSHPKAGEKTVRSKGSRGGYDEKRKQAAIVESKLRMAAAAEAIEKITVLPLVALRAVLASVSHIRSREHNALLPGLSKIIETAPMNGPQFAKAVAVLAIESPYIGEWHEAQQWRKEFLASLKRLGYDAGKHWQKPKPEKKGAPSPAPAGSAGALRASRARRDVDGGMPRRPSATRRHA